MDLAVGKWDGIVAANGPCPRSGHACAVVGACMYIFGGFNGGDEYVPATYYNDLYVLQFESDVPRWEEVKLQGDVPNAREGHTLNAVGSTLYLYGGTNTDGAHTALEGLYAIDTETSTSKMRTCAGNPPRAVSLSAAVSDTRLYTFGGVLSGKAQNSVHILDLETFKWVLAETHGSPPSPRCDHGCVIVGRKMYIVAGSAGEDVWLNDFHCLNLDSMGWSQLDIKGTIPRPRDYPALTCLNNWYLFMFGGFNGSGGEEQSFADLHVLDVTAKILNCSLAAPGGTTPPARYGHTAAILHKKGLSYLVVFGGTSSEGEFNDVWRLQLTVPVSGFEPVAPPRARYTLHTPLPAPRKIVVPAPPKTVKPRDFDEMKTTYMKGITDMFNTLAEKFHEVDVAAETLASERAAFEAEKKAYTELFEQQQKSLAEMLEQHKRQNEEWLDAQQREINEGQKKNAAEKERLEKLHSELSHDQEVFQQKSKKLDAIMKQVQGLTT